MPKHAHARNSNLKALQILRFLKEQFPPEAKVRGSNLQERHPNTLFKHTV